MSGPDFYRSQRKPHLTISTPATITSLSTDFYDHLEENSSLSLDQNVIRYYLARAAMPAMRDLESLPPGPAPKDPELAEISSLEMAIGIWEDLIGKYVPNPEGKTAEEYARASMKEFEISEALLETRFSSGWSMRCYWKECLCAYVFSTYTCSQLQTPHKPWKPIRTRVPHKMKVCTGCWKVWYCGKRCQRR